jgi:molybdate transport system substrate-binding protein
MPASTFRCLLIACLSIGALRSSEADVTVFAAASTTDVLTELAKTYQESEHVTIATSFAASSTLAKQIENGAPADIFISADEKWADYLETRKLLKPGSRIDLLTNRLVVIAPLKMGFRVAFDKGFDFAGAFTGRLAVGDPTNVPVGIYTKEAFAKLGWWESLEPRLAPAADVRAALKLVEIKEAGAGVVYATDAKASAKVEVVGTVPEELHEPIRYPLALTAHAKPAAAAFAAFLASEGAGRVFATHGFQPAAAATKK